MRKYLLFWGLLFCSIPCLLAQETISVRGRVTDSQGQPLLGVSVLLDGTAKGASTNEKGFYEVPIPTWTLPSKRKPNSSKR